MKTIELTKGMVAMVDDADYELLNSVKWYSSIAAGGIFYARRNINKPDGKRGHISMHRFLLSEPEGMCVDHRDGNGLNNQRSNLRACTVSQNTMNADFAGNAVSGYRGVFENKHSKRNPWVARISHGGRLNYLGSFKTTHLAALEYNRAAMVLFGEFARLNQVVTETV